MGLACKVAVPFAGRGFAGGGALYPGQQQFRPEPSNGRASE
jgi:hypothetical protein